MIVPPSERTGIEACMKIVLRGAVVGASINTKPAGDNRAQK
jgi:hypothetical protein